MNGLELLHSKGFSLLLLVLFAAAVGLGCGGGAFLTLMLMRTVICPECLPS